MIGLPPFLSFSENERILQLKILMIILRTVKNISSLNIAASVLLFLAAILAAVVAILIWVVLNKTTFGYELKAVGLYTRISCFRSCICASATSICFRTAGIR